jgi:hypothetical protein
MAWMDRGGKLPRGTLMWSAGVAALIGMAGLGVGIGSGCMPLVIAAYAVIFLAAIVPSLLDWRDAKRRPVPRVRPKARPVAIRWRTPPSHMSGSTARRNPHRREV